MYTPLGIKTDYSILKSLIKIEDLIFYAKKNGFNSLGILDDNLCSSKKFIDECNKNDIKPIIGLELIIDTYKLYFYPKNYNGLTLLFKLYKLSLDNILTIDILKGHNKDIICVVPYISIDIYENINKIYENTFISFSNSDEEKNIRIITDNSIYIKDIYALDKDSSKYVNYLYMIDNNLKLGDIKLVDYKENILTKENSDTSKLTDLIDISLPKGNRFIPHYDETINDSYSYLKALSNKGLQKRLNNKVDNIYQERLDYELKVIKDMGFEDYFLIVFDYVRYAIKNNIFVGAGRGSAAGSLVAYSLGITSIDPIKYNLIFERFLNPERITMPDIDIDFEDERKEEVVDYVKSRYGIEKVAHIMTYGTMTAKEVLRVVSKINNLEDKRIEMLLKHIDSKKSLNDNLNDEVKGILNRNSSLKKVYDEAINLEGLKHHIGTHAAGVVISSKDLTDIIPVIKSGDEYLTGFTMNELEDLGLLKMDFLSIRNLTILTSTLKDIEKYTKKKIDINKIPLNEKRVYEMFSKADTVGVFQFESNGMKNFLTKLKPTCFEDLVMAIAMFRPGPMQNIDEYVERKNKGKKITYIDDSLKPILESTYGILIYQEQIMDILKLMGGYSYGEADIIRRAISKKKLSVIEDEKNKFITNSIKNGYSESVALEVYDLIVKFADYGFNKSHSVAYSMIAYQMAYLKCFYPEYYYINLLNTNIGGEIKTKEYIDEAKRFGIVILKPDINLSTSKYSKEKDGIRLPLRVIKGVGVQASDQIISLREENKFIDFHDFVSRVYGKAVNKKVLENLIDAGALDSFNINRASLTKNIPSAINYADLVKNLDSSLVSKPEIEIIDEVSDIELMKREKELFGYYVSTHPASKYMNVLKGIDISKYFNKIVDTVVLIDRIKTIKTKNNTNMAFITGSDETTSTEFIAFDSLMNDINNISIGDLVKIKGRVERRGEKYQIIIQKIEKI